MRIDEFRKINLKVYSNDDTIVYEGAAEELPEEYKSSQTGKIILHAELAEIWIKE